MQTIIKVRHLTKTYHARERRGLLKMVRRPIHALKGIDLAIERGALFGLLGPNGAGKTTLIKCLTTLLLPTGGEASIAGHDLVRAPAQVRSSVGCMLMGERGLYWKLTGRENLAYFAALYFVPRHQRVAKINRLIDRLSMGQFVDRPVESYSSGQRMKLAFAKALIHDAPILILDEPTNTLDVPSARALRTLVAELNAEGRTIIYTTHVMTEAEALCAQIAIVDRGIVIAQGTPEALKAEVSQMSVIHVRGVMPPQTLPAVHALAAVDGATIAMHNGRQELAVRTAAPQQVLPALIQLLYAQGATIEDISPSRITLEDVFVALTGRTLADDSQAA